MYAFLAGILALIATASKENKKSFALGHKARSRHSNHAYCMLKCKVPARLDLTSLWWDCDCEKWQMVLMFMCAGIGDSKVSKVRAKRFH